MIVEMLLYHGYVGTGRMAISIVGDTGPWTQLALTEPLAVTDALAAWQALADTAFPTLNPVFTWDGAAVSLSGDVDFWVLFAPTNDEILGFSSPVTCPATSSATPRGIADIPVGVTFPQAVEQGELNEYRAARAVALHYGRALEVQLELVMAPDVFAALEGSPLVSGSCALRLGGDPFGDTGGLDGVDAVLFPFDTKAIESDGEDAEVLVTVQATMLDLGASLPALRDTAWATGWGSLRFGYAAHYIARMEGDAVLHMEYQGDADAPNHYSIDEALVIDQSSRIGPTLDEKTYFSKALDLEMRLVAGTETDALFAAPTKFAFLTDDISASATTWPVDTTRGWGSSDLHIGTSRDVNGGALLDSFVSVTRGRYGRQRSYRKGATVTDKPVIWEGRRVDLFVAWLDPMGHYVQLQGDLTTDIGERSDGLGVLISAVMLAGFYVQSRPIRDGNEWVIQCRAQERRLTQPLGVAASGTASWSFDDDLLVAIDPAMVLSFQVAATGTFTPEDPVAFRPLAGQTSPIYESQIRKLITDGLDAQRGVSGSLWVQSYRGDGLGRSWQLYVPVVVTNADTTLITTNVTITGSIFATTLLRTMGESGIGGLPVSGTATYQVPCGLQMDTNVQRTALTVTLDDASPDDLPTAGFVMLESDGTTRYVRYTSFTADAETGVVNLILDPSSSLTGNDMAALAAQDRAGTLAEVSVKFYWLDTGLVKDILRRAIVSTGDAIGGTYDTLPKGQGLGLPDIDEASFDAVFDGPFLELAAVIASEAGTTLQDLFSGILRLSQCGLTSRRSADGTVVEIAAVNVGSPDSVPVLTLTDDSLIASEGTRPVEVLDVYAAPSSISVKCRTIAVGDTPGADAVLNFRDKTLVDWSAIAWDLAVYGITRAALKPAATAWATAWTRAGYNRQVVKLSVAPHHDAQVGDIVSLQGITDPSLWDYANGRTGYTGLARVLGNPLSLTTHLQSLIVGLGGPLSPGPMCPSIPVAFAGFAFYRSDGASGSYADASTNVAARAVFAGTGIPVCSIVFWARNFTGQLFEIGDASDSHPALGGNPAGELDLYINDASGPTGGTPYSFADPGDSSLHQFVIVMDGTNIDVYGDGSHDFGPGGIPGTYAASNALRLFDIMAGGGESPGDIAGWAEFSRTLTSLEIAALYAAGPSHDLTTATGDYATADPVVLWDRPAVSGSVANRGRGGTCDLVLHGGVTSEADASGPLAPIYVAEEWYAILVNARGDASTWKLLAYLPGQDSGRAVYTVSDIGAPSGGLVRLTVTAEPSSPAVTLTTSHRLTWVISDDCTPEQAVYLHADARRQWS